MSNQCGNISSSGDILLSIIVPCYNAEKTILRCLESLRSEYINKRCEIICVDDGSVDTTLEILNDLATQFDNFSVYHQENKGVSAARNAGGGYAKGTWITFVDSDDCVKTDSFEVALSIAEDCQSCDLIVFDYYEKNDLNACKVCSDVFNETQKKIDSANYLDKLINRNKFLSIHSLCNKFFRTNIFQGLWIKENVQLGEDALFNYGYLRQSKIVCTSSTAYYIYNNYGESSLSRGRSLKETWKAYMVILCELKETLEFYKMDELFPMVHMHYCLGTVNQYIKTETDKADEQVLLSVIQEIGGNKSVSTVDGKFNQLLVGVTRIGMTNIAVLLCYLKKKLFC